MGSEKGKPKQDQSAGGFTITVPFKKRTDRPSIHGSRTSCESSSPVQEQDQAPRIARLMALAIHLDGMISCGEINDYAEIARLGMVSRTQVTRVMGLLHLAPKLQEELLFAEKEEIVGWLRLEQDVLPIALEPNWERQQAARATRSSQTPSP